MLGAYGTDCKPCHVVCNAILLRVLHAECELDSSAAPIRKDKFFAAQCGNLLVR